MSGRGSSVNFFFMVASLFSAQYRIWRRLRLSPDGRFSVLVSPASLLFLVFFSCGGKACFTCVVQLLFIFMFFHFFYLGLVNVFARDITSKW